jgi:hypothetical protein
VILLNGFRAGQAGIVSSVNLDARFHAGAFLIRADGDGPGIEQIVNPRLDLFAALDHTRRLPKWLPPLAMREAADLDEVVVTVCNRFLELGPGKWHRGVFYGLIYHCWRRRLPLSEDEIWKSLATHGMSKKFQKLACRAYLEGTELLVYAHGRKPIKKKRVSPLSLPMADPVE